MCVHLRVHSEYSIFDSLIQIPSLIKKAVESNAPAVALTDLGNLFGFVKFYMKAVQAGIKPLVGSEIWIKDQSELGYSSLGVLCQNNRGYQHLTQILSKGYLEAQRRDIPIIPFEWLEPYHEDLIFLSGGPRGGYWPAYFKRSLR